MKKSGWGVHLARETIHTAQYKADTWYLSNQSDHSNMPNQINQIAESDSNIWSKIIKGVSNQSQIMTSLWVMLPWPECMAQEDLWSTMTPWDKSEKSYECAYTCDDPFRDKCSEYLKGRMVHRVIGFTEIVDMNYKEIHRHKGHSFSTCNVRQIFTQSFRNM